MANFIRSFSKKLMLDRLHEISDRIYVFDCCLSRNEMSESEYKPYMDSAVSSLQKHHLGASYMVFNFIKDQTNSQSLLLDILSQHEMMVVDYPLHYENYPLLPLEMIHYFLKSSNSWLSLEGQRNVVLLHCEQGGWPVLAFMLASLLLYSKKCNGEQKTLEMMHKQASKELLTQFSLVNSHSSQLRYLTYISDWSHLDSPLVIDSLILKNVPLLDGKGCRLVVSIYGQDPSVKSDRSPRLLFSNLSTMEAVCYYDEEECLLVKLDIKQHVQGDVFLECTHLGEDLVTQENIFSIMFHTAFVQSNALTLGLDEIDVLWDAKIKFPKEFKTEVHFSIIEEGQDDISSEVATEQDESCYESESEFFEVEEFDISDSEGIMNDSFDWRKRSLPPNYTIEELGDDVASESGIWTQNSEIMFSVESFKQLYLGDLDDEEDNEGESDASSVENIVIIDKTENASMEADEEITTNIKHVVVLSVSQEHDTEIDSHIDEHELRSDANINVDSESSDEGSEKRNVKVEIDKKIRVCGSQVLNQRKNKNKSKLADFE